MQSLLQLLVAILDIYWIVIFLAVVMSWLVNFDVINIRNQFVRMVYQTANGLTEPALQPIRRVLPSIGGLDLSPIVLLLLVTFVRSLLIEYWPR